MNLEQWIVLIFGIGFFPALCLWGMFGVWSDRRKGCNCSFRPWWLPIEQGWHSDCPVHGDDPPDSTGDFFGIVFK